MFELLVMVVEGLGPRVFALLPEKYSHHLAR